MKNELAAAIHKEALAVVVRYTLSEVDLIEILQKVDKEKVFYVYGFNSLFRYACDALKLSEEIAYVFINVARKARQVPALKEEIKKGTISVTKAKKITSVINVNNQAHWLGLAKTASKAKLEKEVAVHSPNGGVRDKMSYVNSQMEIAERAKVLPKARVQLQIGISEKLMLDIRRAQDVLSQKLRRPATLEEVLAAMTSQFLIKEDPVKKAERQKMKGKLQAADKMVARNERAGDQQASDDLASREQASSEQVPGLVHVDSGDTMRAGGNPKNLPKSKPPRRVTLTAKLKHQVALQFDGRCAYQDERGERCKERRFLDIHHLVPVAQGGGNELSNLQLLCSGHHKMHHHHGLPEGRVPD